MEAAVVDQWLDLSQTRVLTELASTLDAHLAPRYHTCTTYIVTPQDGNPPAGFCAFRGGSLTDLQVHCHGALNSCFFFVCCALISPRRTYLAGHELSLADVAVYVGLSGSRYAPPKVRESPSLLPTHAAYLRLHAAPPCKSCAVSD